MEAPSAYAEAPPAYAEAPPAYAEALHAYSEAPDLVAQLAAYVKAPTTSQASSMPPFDINMSIIKLSEQIDTVWRREHQRWNTHLKEGKEWRDIISRIQQQVDLIRTYEFIIGLHSQLYWFTSVNVNTSPTLTISGRINIVTNRRVYTMRVTFSSTFNGSCYTPCTELIQSPVYQFDGSFGANEQSLLRRLLTLTDIQHIQDRNGCNPVQERANDEAVKLFNTHYESFVTMYTAFPGTLLQPLPKDWIEVRQPNGEYLYVNTNTYHTSSECP